MVRQLWISKSRCEWILSSAGSCYPSGKSEVGGEILIVDELLGWAGEQARNRTVSDVRVGLGYTAVRLDNGACGVAYTFREEAGAACSAIHQAGTLTGRPASEVVRLAGALDAVTAAVGVAALNALVEPPPAAEEVDIWDAIQVRPDDVVGMVGYFGPLVGMLRASYSIAGGG
ncbi:MAG: DUF4213 domain-containing protein [bacterium]